MMSPSLGCLTTPVFKLSHTVLTGTPSTFNASLLVINVSLQPVQVIELPCSIVSLIFLEIKSAVINGLTPSCIKTISSLAQFFSASLRPI